MKDVDAGQEPTGETEPARDEAPGEPAVPAEEFAVPDAAPSEPADAEETIMTPVSPVVEAPSDDVDTASDSSALPGEHRGGFKRALTEPVPLAESVQPEVQWAPPPPAPLPRSAPWALALAVLGLMASLVVGWGFVIGIVAIVLAIIALRRPWESRAIAVWALSLAVLSLVYSAGWLWWAWTQAPIVG